MADCKARKMANEVTFDQCGPPMSNCGTFHLKRGLDVELSEGNTVALIGGFHRFDCVHRVGPHAVIDMRRVVFSSKPIEVTGTFQVNATRRKFTRRLYGGQITFGEKAKICRYYDPHQTMAIGFIAYDPEKILVIPHNGVVNSWRNSSDVWMLWEDSVYHDGRKETKHNLNVFKPDGNTIGCRVNEKGYLEFLMDGKNHGVVWPKPLPMDRPLWGFVDLPIEYQIQACFKYDQGPPPPYKPSVDQNPDPQSNTNQWLEQKVADLEAIIHKNSQETHRMQQELVSNQKQLMDMQQQFQTQLTQLESGVQNLKP